MALTKCPRCELNYILDGGSLCTVCRKEVHGKVDREDTSLLCSVCGEAPALPGEDMCKDCLAEFRAMSGAETEEDGDAIEPAELEPEPISGLAEIEGIDGDAETPLADDLDTEEEDALEEALAQA